MKISQMSQLNSLSDSDIIPVVSDGENKAVTGDKLKTYTNDGMQESTVGGGLTNTDLNTLTQTKNYWITTTNITNAPVNSYGFLEVVQVSATTRLQRFTVFGIDTASTRGDTYVRFFVNSQWYGWNKIAHI